MRKEYLKSFSNSKLSQLLQFKVKDSTCHFHALHAEKEQYLETKVPPARSISKLIHSHRVYHLILYTGGRNSFFLNGGFYPSHRGVVVVSSPDEPHYFGACEPGNVRSIEFTFGLEDESRDIFYSLPFDKLLSLITGMTFDQVHYPVRLEEPQYREILSLAESLLISLDDFRKDKILFKLELAIIDVIKFFVRNIYSGDNIETVSAHDNLKQIKLKIENNYNSFITLKELAKDANFSVRHFCRVFKERFGMSPIEYQHYLRLHTAKTLLVSTTMRINEIAEKVGYGDIYQFSRIFKKYFKISPLSYQKKNINRQLK
ncbi:MAG: AraC family transcriptional regulator [Victivallaceae bacterium]|nr:AraC family transcriptional regulator [Victivallaceae bacterium]